METEQRELWRQASIAILSAGLRLSGDGERTRAQVGRSYVDRFVALVDAAITGRPLAWDPRHVRTFLRRLKAQALDASALSFDDALVRPLHVIAAARLGCAVATLDLTGATPDDAVLLGEAADGAQPSVRPAFAAASAALRASADEGQAVTRTPRSGTLITVRVPFVWSREVGGTTKPTLSLADAVVRCATSDESPLVCRLSRGNHDVEVRDHGGTLHRSLAAPGSWERLRLADLRGALSPGCRWADHPYVVASRDGPVASPDEVADPEPARLSGPQRRTRDAAAARALAEVGDLLAVDGIVYRRCPAPRACAVIRVGSSVPEVSWVIPGQVDESLDMGPQRLGAFRDRVPAADDSDTWSTGPQAPCMTVPFDGLDVLRLLARERRRRSWALGATFEVVRPDLLPTDPGWTYQSVVDWYEAQGEPTRSARSVAAVAKAARAGALALRSGREAPVLPELDAGAMRLLAVMGTYRLFRRLVGQTRPSVDDVAEVTSFVA